MHRRVPVFSFMWYINIGLGTVSIRELRMNSCRNTQLKDKSLKERSFKLFCVTYGT